MSIKPRQFDLLIFDFTSYQETVDVCFFWIELIE